MFSLFNVVAYQLAWFAVLIGAARGQAWVGALVALLVCAVHLWQRRDAIEWRLMGACIAIGALVDGVLGGTGQVHYAGWSFPAAPYWMLSLWLAFATTLNHSLRWLMTRPMLAVLVGAVGGPLAYLAGAKLGALELVTPRLGLPMLALLWASAMLTLSLVLSRHSSTRATAEVPA